MRRDLDSPDTVLHIEEDLGPSTSSHRRKRKLLDFRMQALKWPGTTIPFMFDGTHCKSGKFTLRMFCYKWHWGRGVLREKNHSIAHLNFAASTQQTIVRQAFREWEQNTCLTFQEIPLAMRNQYRGRNYVLVTKAQVNGWVRTQSKKSNGDHSSAAAPIKSDTFQ